MCEFSHMRHNFRVYNFEKQLYVEKYADFATYGIAYAVVCSHITGIPITVQVYSVECWPRKYSMSRF